MKCLLGIALSTAVATVSCSGGGVMSHLLPGPGTAASALGRAAQEVIVAPAGWAATGTRGATLPNGSDRGALAPTTPLTVRVALNLHNEDQLKSLIAARQKI